MGVDEEPAIPVAIAMESIPAQPPLPNAQGGAPQIAYMVAVPAMPDSINILEQSNGLFVRQAIQWFEEFTGWEQANKYKVYWRPEGFDNPSPDENALRAIAQNEVFKAKEESEVCMRQCCGSYREFKMTVFETQQNSPSFVFDRPFKCTLPCYCFCYNCIVNPQIMYIRDLAGGTFNTIIQSSRPMSCSYFLDIYDGEQMEPDVNSKSHVLTIEKPCCQFGPNCCCPTVEFKISDAESMGGKQVGRLANIWPGWNVKGLCTKADNYTLEYPREMDVGHKMSLLGAALFVDYLFFEQSNKDDNNNDFGAPSTDAMTR